MWGWQVSQVSVPKGLMFSMAQFGYGIPGLTGFTGLCTKKFNVSYGTVRLGIPGRQVSQVSVPKGLMISMAQFGWYFRG